MTTVEAIVKHPAVSTVYKNDVKIEALTDNIALQALCRLRRMRRNAKRGMQNAREEVAVYGHTYSRSTMPVPLSEAKQLQVAHAHAELLPSDLALLVKQGLGLGRKSAAWR